MHRVWLALGALAGLAAVGLSAWASHAAPVRLEPQRLAMLASGLQQQGWHALALLAVGLWAERRGGVLPHLAGAAFAVGMLLFCGGGLCAGDRRGLAGLGGAGGRDLADGGLGLALRLGGVAQVIGAAYLAAEGFEAELAEELRLGGRSIASWHGRLALSPEPPGPSAWALEAWTAPQEVPAPSVKSAADALRAVQRNWALYAHGQHRRAALIEERLPPVKARPLLFPEPAPTGHLGGWTLLATDRLLFSPTKTSPFVNGAVQFVEDREGPPSRAYLKLWEALTRAGRWPQPGERCLDLGASPGGWTWAIAQLGAEVVAVDKAPLDPAVAAMPGVSVRLESAFGLDPKQLPAMDWLFSDVICYPARLLALVRRWMEAGRARNFCCTIKFQGETDHAAAAEFAAIPGAMVFHGAHNKHELMFVRLG